MIMIKEQFFNYNLILIPYQYRINWWINVSVKLTNHSNSKANFICWWFAEERFFYVMKLKLFHWKNHLVKIFSSTIKMLNDKYNFCIDQHQSFIYNLMRNYRYIRNDQIPRRNWKIYYYKKYAYLKLLGVFLLNFILFCYYYNRVMIFLFICFVTFTIKKIICDNIWFIT